MSADREPLNERPAQVTNNAQGTVAVVWTKKPWLYGRVVCR